MENNHDGNNGIHFVLLTGPDGTMDKKTRHLARSHAVSRGIKQKRRGDREAGRIFVNQSQRGNTATRRQISTSASNSPLVGLPMHETFYTLFSESSEIGVLLSRYRATHTAEPVFSLADELVLRNFRHVLRRGANNDALINAFMLRMILAATAGHMEIHSLDYQKRALVAVRTKLSCPMEAASESTLGAILLLAGAEAQMGSPSHVQLHMGAVQKLILFAGEHNIYMSDSLKRAIFWHVFNFCFSLSVLSVRYRSDLNYSVMMGTTRIVNHSSFAELVWTRESTPTSWFALPPGFRKVSYLLGESFLEIVEDIHALQQIRDHGFFDGEDEIAMARIDNHQASIQSRLADDRSQCCISRCCHLAAYLCSTMLRCQMWRTSTIPSHLSLKLALSLQDSIDKDIWNDNFALLTWLVLIGGAFAPVGWVREMYCSMLKSSRFPAFAGYCNSWSNVRSILDDFIWSDSAFGAQVEAFVKEYNAKCHQSQTSTAENITLAPNSTPSSLHDREKACSIV